MADCLKYTFHYLPSKQFNSITGKDFRESFLKWGMSDRIKAQAFSFDQNFHSYDINDFAAAFFKDSTVLQNLHILSSSGSWVALATPGTSVSVESVPCTALSLTFFDRLYNGEVVRESGSIVKCFDEYFDDMVLSDELRKLLVMPDSDHYDLYSESERSEFIFRLFHHFCLGGELCQYEDAISPYLEATKAIYKDLLSVQKDKTGQISVISFVYKVTASTEDGAYYPADVRHQQNFAYLIVDPLKRHVNILYHKFSNR